MTRLQEIAIAAARGRPTTYKPEFADLVVSMGKEGASLSMMASGCDTLVVTLIDWAEMYPDFAAALTRARQESLNWWEKQGQSALGLKSFQSAVWAKMISSMFREEYGERASLQIEHNVSHRITDAKQLARELALLLAETGEAIPMIDVTPNQAPIPIADGTQPMANEAGPGGDAADNVGDGKADG